jgi:hypothetical protein
VTATPLLCAEVEVRVEVAAGAEPGRVRDGRGTEVVLSVLPAGDVAPGNDTAGDEEDREVVARCFCRAGSSLCRKQGGKVNCISTHNCIHP